MRVSQIDSPLEKLGPKSPDLLGLITLYSSVARTCIFLWCTKLWCTEIELPISKSSVKADALYIIRKHVLYDLLILLFNVRSSNIHDSGQYVYVYVCFI